MPNIARYRRNSERKMPDIVEIQRFTEEGEPPVGDWSTIHTTKGRATRMSATEATIAGGLRMNASATVRIPFRDREFIKSTDRLRITDRETGVTRIADIAGIPVGSGSYTADLQIYVRFDET